VRNGKGAANRSIFRRPDRSRRRNTRPLRIHKTQEISSPTLVDRAGRLVGARFENRLASRFAFANVGAPFVAESSRNSVGDVRQEERV